MCIRDSFFAGAYSPAFELPLHDLQAFLYLRLNGAGAVPPKQKLGYVRWDGILALESTDKVFANNKPFKGSCRDLVEAIELHDLVISNDDRLFCDDLARVDRYDDGRLPLKVAVFHCDRNLASSFHGLW